MSELMKSVDDAPVLKVMHQIAKGRSLIRIRCACGSAADGPGRRKQPGRAIRMFQEKGWDVDKDGRLATCPRCQKMGMTSPSGQAPTTAARRMQRAAFRLLEDHFDEDTGRYEDGWSDEKIAEKIGLSESIVAGYRNDAFRELAVDPDLERIREAVEAVERRWTTEKAKLAEEVKTLDRETGEALAALKIDLAAVVNGFKPVGAAA